MRADGGVGVVTLDLDDPAQVAAADAYIQGEEEGTPFHRPAWIKAIERGTGNRAYMLAAVASSGACTRHVVARESASRRTMAP